jgi:PQQ enzyme-like repeat protein
LAPGNPPRRSHCLRLVAAALLLGAPAMARVSAQALPPGEQPALPAGAVRFSELAEVTTANVGGLLPLVARSVRPAGADAALDSPAAIDLSLQHFVEARTAALGPRASGRSGGPAGALNQVVSYVLEGDGGPRKTTGAVPAGRGNELRAWDPIARHVLWSVHESLPICSGTLLTAGGLVFYGTGDGWFKALDARTGQTLWRHRVDGKQLAAPASYRGADGHQYIAVRALPRTPGEGGETVLLFALAH